MSEELPQKSSWDASSSLRPGGFTASVGETDGAILVGGDGVWSLAVLDAHLDSLRTPVERRRANGYPIRVLVDLRGADVPPAELVERTGFRTSQIHAADDRVAIVVATDARRSATPEARIFRIGRRSWNLAARVLSARGTAARSWDCEPVPE